MIVWAIFPWILIIFLQPCIVLGGGITIPQQHSIRHHQVGSKVKKTTADVETNDVKDGVPGGLDSLISTSTTFLPDLVVSPHQEVRLDCMLPADVAPMHFTLGINWVQNGQPVDVVDLGVSDTGHRYSKDPIHGHLIISNVRLEDDGLWQCQYRATPADTMVTSKPVKLTVLDRPRNPYLLIDGRRLDPGNLFIPVKENTELSVSCVVEGGNPPPVIKWALIPSATMDSALFGEETPIKSHLNVTVSGDGKYNRVFSHSHTRSDARVENILRSHHNATVLCFAEHSTLPTALNASLLLDVQYSPSFAISREPGFGFPIREGIPVSLKCDVDSNPQSSPIWQKDDGPPPVPQSGDGFLNFSAIKRDDSGWYKCTSNHLLGDFSSIGYFLNVRFDPVVEVTAAPSDISPTGRHLEVALGGTVQLQCPEETQGCWSRVGGGGRLEPVGPGPKLAIEDVLYQDAGEYRCVFGRRNSHEKWRSEINVDVTVEGRPLVYPGNTTLTAYTGQRLDISVEFCSNPPATKAFWITEKLRLRPGQVTQEFTAHNLTNGSSIHCQQAVLTLKKVQADQEGEYIFLVRSSKGLADGSIMLNVTHVSSFSSSTSTRIQHTISPLWLILTLIFLRRTYYKYE